jgi:hypothetical protein
MPAASAALGAGRDVALAALMLPLMSVAAEGMQHGRLAGAVRADQAERLGRRRAAG